MAPIQKVFRAAKKTFARSRSSENSRLLNQRPQRPLDTEEFNLHLKELSTLMNDLTAKDLGLDQSAAINAAAGDSRSMANGEKEGVAPAAAARKSRAPVTYIGLKEDQDLSMGVFIINPRGRMPLHNHPQMHGILKMLQGTVEVLFYNRVKPVPQDLPEALKSRLDLLEKDVVVPTLAPNRVTVGPDSKPLVLYPDKDNFHEIRLVEGPAAFLDILSPPYNSVNEEDGSLEIPGDERRDCGFYKDITRSVTAGTGKFPPLATNPSIHWLHRLRTQPADYFCDQEPYKGPPL